jgi:hypothetical protein
LRRDSIEADEFFGKRVEDGGRFVCRHWRWSTPLWKV